MTATSTETASPDLQAPELPPEDRRACRSNEDGTALRYQLESTLKRGRMEAVALADTSGILLAWAGEQPVCAEIGALAPLVARGAPARVGAEIDAEEMSVRAIDCFGQSLFLASIGGGVARDALLAHSARGIQRILTAN